MEKLMVSFERIRLSRVAFKAIHNLYTSGYSSRQLLLKKIKSHQQARTISVNQMETNPKLVRLSLIRAA